jgi:hypothetical protein
LLLPTRSTTSSPSSTLRQPWRGWFRAPVSDRSPSLPLSLPPSLPPFFPFSLPPESEMPRSPSLLPFHPR